MYQQKATQLALLQRTNPNFERNNEKKYKMRTLTLIGRSRQQRDADDVRTESFFSDDSEIEPMVKKGGIQHSTQ